MPAQASELLNRAYSLLEQGKLDQASRLLKQLLKSSPETADVYHYLGLIDYQQNRFKQAAQWLEKAIELDSSNAVFRNNFGLGLLACDQTQAAILQFSAAIELDPAYAQAWFNRGNAKCLLKDFQSGQSDYEKAIAIDPFFADAYNNLGNLLRQLGKIDHAAQVFKQCLELQPAFYAAHNNLGLAQQAMADNDSALESFRTALALAPNYVEAHVNAGNLLQHKAAYADALIHYRAAYKLSPRLDLLLGNIAQCKAMLCDWHDFNTQWKLIARQAKEGQLPCSPFVMLSGCDDPALSLRLAQQYQHKLVPTPDVEPFKPRIDESKEKLRIGYFSSDLKEHPVAYLTVGILEHHDRDRFEVMGFALSKPANDPLGQRICKSFDQLFDLSTLTDEQAIALARSKDLDIAIDLNGYIDGGRPGIFKGRVAATQVNYYGYPGTMGASFMDYIIGDHHLMPTGFEDFYQEKIIYLPDCYQPNDDQREISQNPNRRVDHGLPDDALVLCCFNKPYKITPEVFDCWMNILNEVQSAVLWLQAGDPTVVQNLQKAASKRGINADRLIFAQRVPTTAEHLARYRLADLFLDTFPYTAHTTANDSLWAGLPVVGLSGRTFSARVSESLLNALGLEDLVSHSLANYQAKVIELAKNPELLNQIRTRLTAGKSSSSLYEPEQICRWLESGLTLAHERIQAGQKPDHIRVAR